MRAHRLIGRLVRLASLIVGAVVAIPSVASAQQVNVTPITSITPSDDVTQWINWMAIGSGILGFLVLILIVAGYMRFAPKFFGRGRAPRPAPGARPQLLGRPDFSVRAPVGATRPFTRPVPEGAATAERPAATATGTATAVAERPGAGGEPPAEAEPSAAAPATEAQAPARAEATATAEAEAPAVAEAPPSADAAAAPSEAPAPQADSAPAPSQGGGAGMDQGTFDRVLQEQLSKGVDRRVAEGRARAAAVVAARKKAKG